MMRRFVVATLVAAVSLAVLGSTASPVHAKNSGATVEMLARGPVNLPAGKAFVNILDFRQVQGVTFTIGSSGIVYALRGIATVSFPRVGARSIGQGEAVFIPPKAMPTVTDADGRVGAVAIALGLVVVVILLCVATLVHGGPRRAIIAGLTLVLIAGGALALVGPTSNDWYLFAARPEFIRSWPMPVPYGRVTYNSPDLNPVPTAPYYQILVAISVPPGARYDSLDLPGPAMIIVVEGTAAVHLGDVTKQLGSGQTALAQAGTSLAIDNPGSDTLRVLDFAVTPVPRSR